MLNAPSFPPFQKAAKGPVTNWRKEVSAALRSIGKKGGGHLTVCKWVANHLGKTVKQVRAHCLIALRGMVRKGTLTVTKRGRYHRVSKKKATAAKKKKPTTTKTKKAKKAVAAKKPKSKAMPKKAPKRKAPAKAAVAKKKKKTEPKVKRAKKAVVPLEGAAAAPLETGAAGPHWEFFDRVWRPYDKAASDTVEAAYQEYLHDPGMLDVRSVRSGSWAYQVDFLNMQQTNIEHTNHTVRQIRRNPPAVPRAAAK